MAGPYLGEIILVGFNFAPTGWALCDGQLLLAADYPQLYLQIGNTYGGSGATFAVPDLRGRVPIGMGQGSGSNYAQGDTGGAETVTLAATHLPSHTHAIDVSAVTASLKCKNGAGNQSSPVGTAVAVASDAFTDTPLAAGVTTIKAVHIVELRTRVNNLRAQYLLPVFSYTDPTLTSVLIRAQHILDLRVALAGVYSAVQQSQPQYTDPGLAAGSPVKAAHISDLRNAVVAVGGAQALPYSSAAPDANMSSSTALMGGTATLVAAGGGQPHTNLQPSLALNYCISLTGVPPPT